MFDSILIRPNSHRGHSLDYGQVIENLFFYQETIAHIGRTEIPGLFELADVDVLEQLLRLPSLSIYYNNSHTGIGNDNDIHFVDSFGLANLDLEKELYEESFRYKGDAFKSRKFSKKLARLIKVHELPKDFNKVMNEQLKDKEFRDKVLIETINHYQPNHGIHFEDLRFELEFLDDNNFKIHSNFDTIGINQNLIVDNSPILSLINACEDLFVMSESASEVSLPEFNSKIIRLKVNSSIERGTKSQKEIEVFNHYNFNESWALREAINSKRIHVKAAINILRKGDKYKSWLQNLPQDSNLMFEYVQKIQEHNVLESLPAKAIRFYVFNGLGAILSEIKPEVGIPFTLALNAFDTFILDNLGKKWTPNQFIESELRPLIKNKNEL